MADRVISDIEDGKEGYDPDLCFYDDCFDINYFMEDS